MLYSLFIHHGNLAGFFMVVIGALFYAFVQKSVGIALLLLGGGLLVFFYVF